MNITMESTATSAPLNRTARRNAMRAAKKSLQAPPRKSQAAKEEGEQHVWHVTMTLAGDDLPGDSIVVATTPEFVKRAMIDRYARDSAPDVLAALVLHVEQLDDGRFQGPFKAITAGPDEDGNLIDGPYDSLLEATNRADDIFDIGDYDEGSRIFDRNGNEVLHLTLKTRDTGVVRYLPGYYD